MNVVRSSYDERRQSRVAALQMLYQRDISGFDGPALDEAMRCYWVEHQTSDSGRRVADRLVHGTVDALDRIDALIEAVADHWRLSRMAVVDRTVLRLAVYELLAERVPPAVVIDEAIELARAFSDAQSPRFVNGVLDAVWRGLTDAAED